MYLCRVCASKRKSSYTCFSNDTGTQKLQNALKSCFRDIGNFGKLSFVSFFAAVFFTGSIELISGLLLLVTIVASLRYLPTSVKTLRNRAVFTKIYLYTTAVFLVIVLLHITFGESGSFGYGLPFSLSLTFIMALAIAAHFANSGQNAFHAIALASGAHATLLLLISISQIYLFGYERAEGTINANIFAHILATSGGIFTIYLFLAIKTAPSLKALATFLLWLLLFLFGTHLTGTRGVIIAYYPLLLGLALVSLVYFEERKHQTILVLLIAIVFLTLLSQNAGRFALGMSEFARTADGLENQGSIGMRVGAWQEALRLIAERPFTGHGLRYFSDFNTLPRNNPVQNFTHVHNQYLDIWVKAGIGGLVFLLVFLGLPFFVGVKILFKNLDPGVGLTLIWLGGSFMVYGLTEVFINHTNTIVILATYIPLFLLLADRKFRTPAT